MKRVCAMPPFQVAVANLKIGSTVKLRDSKNNMIFIVDRPAEHQWFVGVGSRDLSQDFSHWFEVCSFLPDNLVTE